jgi:hypothetical protein
MIQAIKSQVAFAMKQKAAILTFYLLLTLVLLNFTTNVFAFQGSDVIEMYHPAKMLVLSYNRIYYNADMTLLLVQLYPVIVVCPAGFTLISEKNRKTDTLLIARMGSKKYYVSKVAASFIVTSLVFVIPPLIELVLNCISFPTAATGDFINLNQYNPRYVEMVSHYTFAELFKIDSYLYSVISTLFFGVFSGILGMFTVALSMILKVRYKIFLFLPVFVLLNISLYFSEIIKGVPFSVRWFDYVYIFNDAEKSGAFFIVAVVMLMAVSFFCAFYKGRRDHL